jgi:AraC-like DNA-binding protein
LPLLRNIQVLYLIVLSDFRAYKVFVIFCRLMNLDIRIGPSDQLFFRKGIPLGLDWQLLPRAMPYYAQGDWGTICLQEVRTAKYLLRHILFRIHQNLSFHSKEKNEGLQSLLSVKGNVEYHVQGLKKIDLKEKEYILFDAKEEETVLTVGYGKICSIINAYYTPDSYSDLITLLPNFKSDLKKAIAKPFSFSTLPKVARYTVHDGIEAIWIDKYVAELELKYIELKIESSLFTMLAQTYTQRLSKNTTLREREKSLEAHNLIMSDLTKHFTLKQIAAQIHCSQGLLKKGFKKVYGTGLFHLLRKTRMEIAREMLLKGESLKVVALEVGMKPQNFPKEFKSYFGYTVTTLKKGLP